MAIQHDNACGILSVELRGGILGATVQIFNRDQRVAKTSRAFDCKITHELMRMYTLEFSVANTDAAQKYILPDVTTFICDGQAYDIQEFKKQSGAQGNTTAVKANHVAYRLNNYSLAAGYSFVGTIQQIAQDILDQAINVLGGKASSEFVIGTVPDIGTVSFSLGNTDSVTAKYAIMALEKAGAESDFDNFTINFSTQIGEGQSQTFEFGVNMSDAAVTYNKSNGTTFEVGIADLQVQDPANHPFDIGWYGHGIDKYTGESFTERIITYTKWLDNPSKNSITLGTFISDISSDVATMSVAVDNSVQQGAAYNNCQITRKNGFVCTNTGSTIRVMQNATNGFIIQHSGDSGSTWTDIFTVDSSDGKITIYSADMSKKVELGSGNGLAFYVSTDGGTTWTLVGGADSDGHSIATKIYRPGYPDQYGIIGVTGENNVGLELHDASSGTDVCFAKLLELEGGKLGIFDGTGAFELQVGSDGLSVFKSGTAQNYAGDLSVPFGNGSLEFKDGLINAVSYSLATSDITISGVGTLHFQNGMLTGVTT